MDKALSYSFQVDSPQAKNAYETLENFEIQEFPERDSDLCVIYFSSNEIYYPNTEAVFENQILKKNRFEWWGARINDSAKDILIRDNRKQWYLSGINGRLSTIEKMVEWLRKETKRMRIVTVGSSSGGFAAILFGNYLDAERVLAFNPQFNIEDLLERSVEAKDPIVFRHADAPNYRQYYDITDRLNSKVFYFCSTKSQWDREQFEFTRNKDLNILRFNCRNHGIPFPRTLLATVINLPTSELKQLTRKTHHPFLFSVRYRGWWQSAIDTIQLILKRIQKKREERRNTQTDGQ